MKKFLFYLVQFTWALPQNLVGGIGFLALRKKYRARRNLQAVIDHRLRDRGNFALEHGARRLGRHVTGR